MRELPTRKHLRLLGYDYSKVGSYFITICVKDRHEVLGQIVGRDDLGAPYTELSEYGMIVQKYVDEIHLHHEAIVEKYVIMPNHIHLIINIADGAPGSSRPTTAMIPKIITSLKKMTSKEIGFTCGRHPITTILSATKTSIKKYGSILIQTQRNGKKIATTLFKTFYRRNKDEISL